MCQDQFARMVIKRGSGVPTIPVSADHRNGDWIATDIYEGEQYLDTDTGLVYTRNGSDIIISGETASYKIYVANLTQTGTSAPTAEVLENTLGGTPTFNYVGVGSYEMELTGAFPAAKTHVMINAITSSGLSGADRKTDNKIGLASFNTTFTTSNNVFVKTSIVVKVYA